MRQESKAARGVVNQFARYLMCGGLAAGIHLGVLVVLVEFFGVSKMISSGIGFVLASGVNITLQRLYIFSSDRPFSNILVRYSVITSFTLMINQVLFFVAIEYLAIPYTIAQILVIGVLVVVNFGLNRAITFSDISVPETGR